jgi:hypothetical protein
MKGLLLAAASAAAVYAAPNIPTVQLCNHDGSCIPMPVVGEGR